MRANHIKRDTKDSLENEDGTILGMTQKCQKKGIDF